MKIFIIDCSLFKFGYISQIPVIKIDVIAYIGPHLV